MNLHRTPAQRRADQRRSHKACAKREQRHSAINYAAADAFRDFEGASSTVFIGNLASAAAIAARMARCHLNFLLIGSYVDFV